MVTILSRPQYVKKDTRINRNKTLFIKPDTRLQDDKYTCTPPKKTLITDVMQTQLICQISSNLINRHFSLKRNVTSDHRLVSITFVIYSSNLGFIRWKRIANFDKSITMVLESKNRPIWRLKCAWYSYSDLNSYQMISKEIRSRDSKFGEISSPM